METVEGL
jgi:hypothetical protein